MASIKGAVFGFEGRQDGREFARGEMVASRTPLLLLLHELGDMMCRSAASAAAQFSAARAARETSVNCRLVQMSGRRMRMSDEWRIREVHDESAGHGDGGRFENGTILIV